MGIGKDPVDKPGRVAALTVSHVFHQRQEESQQKRKQHWSAERKQERAKGQRGREGDRRVAKAWRVC